MYPQVLSSKAVAAPTKHTRENRWDRVFQAQLCGNWESPQSRQKLMQGGFLKWWYPNTMAFNSEIV